ncbi:hypothetical protein Lser_V15G17117 [Lactuca serriola]
MARELSNILDITRQLNKKWTVLVQVLETGHIQLSNSNSLYRRLLFVDSQGTKVTTLIFRNDLLQAHRYSFQLYNRYYISNADLLNTKEQFLVSAYPYSWAITGRTLIKRHPDSVPPTLLCQFQFTPFSKLYKHAETDNCQDIKGIVIECFDTQILEDREKPTKKRDIVVVNQEKKPMIVTLWNGYADEEGSNLQNTIRTAPIIYGLKLKVTTFNGVSLTMRNSFGIMINPPSTQDQELRNWYNENKSEVSKLLEQKAYKNTDLLLPYPEEEDVISIAEATEPMTTSIDADNTWIVTCSACKTESEVQLISRATIEIDDGTGTIRTVISTPEIEKFISSSPAQVRDAEEYETNVHDTISMGMNQVTNSSI